MRGLHLVAWIFGLGGLAAAFYVGQQHRAEPGPASGRWFPVYGPDVVDLRHLNEAFAGENGFVGVKEGNFVRGPTSEPVRFWGVNVIPSRLEVAELPGCARMLGRHGVNLARIHGPIYDEAGNLDESRLQKTLAMVESFKAEGIYSHLSIYYWDWLRPRPGTSWLLGYDGRSRPVAALFFDPDFQAHYRKWWKSLLLSPSVVTGRRLVDEPAVASLEIQNEDSLLFWTFDPATFPTRIRHGLEKRFGDWLLTRYSSLQAALETWGSRAIDGDDLTEGRMAVRPISRILRERTARDVETVRFLVDLQTSFYRETYAYIRGLGFRGVIGTSNWKTASPELLDPLEALTYMVGDFTDRHAYVGTNRAGDDAAWALRVGQTFDDPVSLRLETGEPRAPGVPLHPSATTHFKGKPSMLSEVSWERPSTHRSEGPISLAVFGALQHEDAIVHFALDGCRWSTSPRPNVQQPWTLASPAMMGQFPAAAVLFRRGLVANGEQLAALRLGRETLLALDANGPSLVRDVDPLGRLVGRTDVTFVEERGDPEGVDVRMVQRRPGTIVSATGEVEFDYRHGILRIDSARAQGASGALGRRAPIETRDLEIRTESEQLHVLAVSLDELPLDRSGRILLQVMSEEVPSGFTAGPAGIGRRAIQELGHDPWMIREISGTIRFRRPDASRLRVTPLDGERASAPSGDASSIQLRPSTLHYLIELP